MIRLLHRGAAIAAAAVVIVVVAAGPVFADDPNTIRLNTIISNLTAWVVGILAGVATLFATIGGLRYLSAGGDPAEVEKAKSAFKSALIGYALAILAPVLLGIVKSIVG
jgi:hypothetical protein